MKIISLTIILYRIKLQKTIDNTIKNMYNTLEVSTLEITKAKIVYFKKSSFDLIFKENVRHVKILPCLSIVQSIEGRYDIALGKSRSMQTKEGGFFIAPSGVQQTIVHHPNEKSGRMSCRWLFIDVEINDAYKLDCVYQFDTVINDERADKLNLLFDDLFSNDDIFKNYSCCYQILGVLSESSLPIEKPVNKGIEDTVAYMTENFGKPIGISELAKIANMSESNFYCLFKKLLGTSPIAYLNNYRLSIASERLLESDEPIGSICNSVGIADPMYFSKIFSRTYGYSPREYRKKSKKKTE